MKRLMALYVQKYKNQKYSVGYYAVFLTKPWWQHISLNVQYIHIACRTRFTNNNFKLLKQSIPWKTELLENSLR